MFSTQRRQTATGLEIALSGTINEFVNFNKEIGETPDRLRIICREITHINSMGIKLWVDYFSQLASEGKRLVFCECPPNIVEQINYDVSFLCGASVDSMIVPYSCGKCHREIRKLMTVGELKAISFRPGNVSCPKCNSAAEFDDTPEDYFGFLMANKT